VSNSLKSYLAAQDTTAKESDPLYNSTLMRRHVGDISAMTEWRWTRQLAFPKPDVIIARRKFWRRSTLDRWLDRMAQATS
jgi:hypothetical protein